MQHFHEILVILPLRNRK